LEIFVKNESNFAIRPRFFSNRDYVCGRRAQVFDDKIVVYSKSTEHPTCPPKSKTFRVEDYWYFLSWKNSLTSQFLKYFKTNFRSVLTIKPFTSFDQLGIEFSLTAFENPGCKTKRLFPYFPNPHSFPFQGSQCQAQ